MLEADPFHSAFTRHRQSLQGAGDEVTLASLLTRRAERQPGTTAAETWLEAAEAFRRAGAPERSQLCEAQAFDAAPAHREAFERLFAEARSDVRRQASLIEMRARALPTEAAALLRQRAELLTGAQESLLAAEAWDDYLALAPLDSRALEQRADLAFAGGGARAAQPFYRALVQRAGETLSRAQRLRAWSRLGQAALEAQAWRDAVDAYELVFDLDAGGEGGREALTHLSEAYVRLGDAGGQYRTALRLARTLSGAEAEALYRRAVACVDAPEKAIEALEALLVRQVADAELYAKAQQAFRAARRIGDLVALHEHHAAAVGGPAAAAALLAAAHITEDELRDGQRAFELRLEATRLDPVGGSAAHGVLDELRRRRDHHDARHVAPSADGAGPRRDRGSRVPARVGRGARACGHSVEASSLYEALRARGPKAAGAAQALAGLERLAAARGDELAVAALRVEACELLGEEARALVLLEAARVFLRAGQPERALSTSRMALAARSTRAGLELAVEVTRSLGEPRALAQALLEYAGALGGDEKARILLEASQAWASIDPEKARDALERAVREAPGAVSWRVAAERFAALGDAARALELGYQPALDAGELELALRLAEAGGDDARRTAVLWRMVERDAAAPAAARLAEQLRAASDADGLARLAALLWNAAIPRWPSSCGPIRSSPSTDWSTSPR